MGLVLWGVDAQADFMLPDGKLYVPGAEKIIPNLNRLVEQARWARVLLISSADAHQPDDPEFREWPAHCVKGTAGAELVPEARAARRLRGRAARASSSTANCVSSGPAAPAQASATAASILGHTTRFARATS